MVDWLLGYEPPATNVKRWLEKVLLGTGTYAELMNRFEKNQDDIEAATELGKKYENKGEFTKALEFYEEALKAHASGAEGITLYGLVEVPCAEFAEFSIAKLTLIERSQEGAVALKTFIEKYPKSPYLQRAYLDLCWYFSRHGSKEDAEKFFEECFSRFPDNPKFYRYYARRILRNEGDVEKGAALIEKTVELTRSQYLEGNIGFLIEDFDEFQVLKGDNSASLEVFGKEFMKFLGEDFCTDLVEVANFWLDKNTLKDEAEECADLIASLTESGFFIGNSGFFTEKVVEIYIRLNKVEKAFAKYGPDFVKQNWSDAAILSRYASFWTKQELNLENALEAAKRSLELGPGKNDFVYWSRLSEIFLKLKNYEEALNAAEKALELAPISYTSSYKAKVEKIRKLIKEE
ncbi:tetratricopeptide repeat protein [Acidobacteriota bacterium]